MLQKLMDIYGMSWTSLYELFNCHRHIYIEKQGKVIWRTEMESKIEKEQNKKKEGYKPSRSYIYHFTICPDIYNLL